MTPKTALTILRSYVSHVKRQNMLYEQGDFTTRPLASLPMSRLRTDAIIRLAYGTAYEQSEGQKLTKELDALEQRNLELAKDVTDFRGERLF